MRPSFGINFALNMKEFYNRKTRDRCSIFVCEAYKSLHCYSRKNFDPIVRFMYNRSIHVRAVLNQTSGWLSVSLWDN